MANREHLRRLTQQGVRAWNAWRQVDLSKPELRDADLGGADLRGAALSGVNFRWTILNGADLSGADLSGADLSESGLSEANLSKASLHGAALVQSDLTAANFKGASLRWADLRLALLSGADFEEALLYETILSGVDLSDCKNLGLIRHEGPSALDIRTLQNSGRLPLAFLRGVGLPDTLIDYLPSLLGQSIQFFSCFISYASRDDDFARRLHADLQNNGVRCWFGRRSPSSPTPPIKQEGKEPQP
jgi:hypothetical protein